MIVVGNGVTWGKSSVKFIKIFYSKKTFKPIKKSRNFFNTKKDLRVTFCVKYFFHILTQFFFSSGKFLSLSLTFFCLFLLHTDFDAFYVFFFQCFFVFFHNIYLPFLYKQKKFIKKNYTVVYDLCKMSYVNNMYIT